MLQPHAGATAVLGIVIGLSWARWHFEICRREVPVGLIELIVTVCATAQMNLCQEQHLEFAWNGSLRQCTIAAQPYIAQWIGEHPKWTAVRWRCEDVTSRKEPT